MTEIIEELNAARNLLHTALDRYVNACRAVQNSHFGWEGHDHDCISRIDELPNCAAKELRLFTSYKKKLKRAKAAMAATRNSSSTIVPINTLPSEILSRIFALVIHSKKCIAKKAAHRVDRDAMMHIEDLLSVCSNWRRFAINTRALWTHIDLAPGDPINEQLLTRAKVYAARAGQAPLQIHIADGPAGPELEESTPPVSITYDEDDDTLGFLASIAARTSSLELTTKYPLTYFHCEILQSVFENGVPGVFTQLRISSWGPQSGGFFGSIESPNTTEDLALDLPESFLEYLWLRVTVLSLDGQFPYWTSKAYSGLVELRLTTGLVINTIPPLAESHLIGILTASPGLRRLHFNIPIADPLPKNSPIVPVRLDDLEELRFISLPQSQFGTFLRLLSPGPKLTRLPLYLDSESEPPMANFDEETRAFFSRSYITDLRVTDARTFQLIPELCSLPSRIQVRVVECFSNEDNFNPRSYSDKDTVPMHLRTTDLYLFFCQLTHDQLLWIAEKLPVRRLTLWACQIQIGDEILYDEEFSHISGALSQHCPTVEIFGLCGPRPALDRCF